MRYDEYLSYEEYIAVHLSQGCGSLRVIFHVMRTAFCGDSRRALFIFLNYLNKTRYTYNRINYM